MTFSCYHKYHFLQADRTWQSLADSIQQARKKHSLGVWAYVFMPNHVHMIVYPRLPGHKMRTILSAIKLPVSQRAIRFLEASNSSWLERITRQRGRRRERLFWQSGGGHDRNITSGKTLLQMIEYLHMNPVRSELVTQACD